MITLASCETTAPTPDFQKSVICGKLNSSGACRVAYILTWIDIYTKGPAIINKTAGAMYWVTELFFSLLIEL